MSRLLIVLLVILLSACGDDKPKTHYKYLVWIDAAGYYTNNYEIKEGAIYFIDTNGRKLISNKFEVVESIKGYDK